MNLKLQSSSFEGAGIVQWWERSPAKNVSRVRLRPRVTCWLSLLLFPTLHQGFFPVFPGFPASTKTNICKFHFDQHRRARIKKKTPYLRFLFKYNCYFLSSVERQGKWKWKHNSVEHSAISSIYLALFSWFQSYILLLNHIKSDRLVHTYIVMCTRTIHLHDSSFCSRT